MKKILLTLCLIFSCSFAQAACVAEVKDVIIDPIRGKIVIKTDYVLNGVLVQNGESRYSETTGTKAEIVALAKADIKHHCENLIFRITENKDNIEAEFLALQKSFTEPLLADLKTNAIGYTTTVTEAKRIFKGKEITVNADSTYSIIDAP